MYSVWNCLTVIEKLLFYNTHVVIPQALKPEMLLKLHTGHMGVTKTLLRAQQSMWYPRITVDIKNMIRQCNHYQVHKNVQKAELLIPHSLPDQPWQRVDINMLTHRHQMYMAVSDEYS